ncbi:hypothetical protein BH11PSE14_BH11PSE14_24040 [soil metagenome]
MSAQRFEIVPPGKFTRMVPLLVGGLAPAIVLLGIAWTAAAQHRPLTLRDVLPPVLVLPIAGVMMAASIYRRSIRVQDGSMAFGMMPWRRVRVDALDLDAARVLDLNAHRELQPVSKIAGSGLPGFRSGLFRLRDRRRGQVLLTDWRRVLVLPKRDGGVILLSPERPDALLAALQATATNDSSR